MKRTPALGVFVLALAVVFVTASSPGAFAQDPKGGGGGGGANPRGGGDTGGARGGAAAPAPSSPGGSSGSSMGGSMPGGGMSGGGMPGGSFGPSGVPRGAGRVTEGGGRQPGGAGARWGGGAAGREGRPDGSPFGRSAVDDQMSGRSRTGSGSSGVESSVPWYSRPRGANPATGTAVPRPDVPGTNPPAGGGGYYPGYPGYGGGYWGGYYGGYYDCYYSYYPYGCNPWGYGAFGLGYFYFNPFGWNYGDYGWGSGGGGGGSYGGQPMGSIRLKVKPSNASVYVDGYYAGTVDSFDNSFQKLSVALGSHRIEISAPGYQPLVIEINVPDYDTIVYEGRLEPIR